MKGVDQVLQGLARDGDVEVVEDRARPELDVRRAHRWTRQRTAAEAPPSAATANPAERISPRGVSWRRRETVARRMEPSLLDPRSLRRSPPGATPRSTGPGPDQGKGPTANSGAAWSFESSPAQTPGRCAIVSDRAAFHKALQSLVHIFSTWLPAGLTRPVPAGGAGRRRRRRPTSPPSRAPGEPRRIALRPPRATLRRCLEKSNWPSGVADRLLAFSELMR